MEFAEQAGLAGVACDADTWRRHLECNPQIGAFFWQHNAALCVSQTGSAAAAGVTPETEGCWLLRHNSKLLCLSPQLRGVSGVYDAPDCLARREILEGRHIYGSAMHEQSAHSDASIEASSVTVRLAATGAVHQQARSGACS